VIFDGFLDWIPEILRLGALGDKENSESIALAKAFQQCEQILRMDFKN